MIDLNSYLSERLSDTEHLLADKKSELSSFLKDSVDSESIIKIGYEIAKLDGKKQMIIELQRDIADSNASGKWLGKDCNIDEEFSYIKITAYRIGNTEYAVKDQSAITVFMELCDYFYQKNSIGFLDMINNSEVAKRKRHGKSYFTTDEKVFKIEAAERKDRNEHYRKIKSADIWVWHDMRTQEKIKKIYGIAEFLSIHEEIQFKIVPTEKKKRS